MSYEVRLNRRATKISKVERQRGTNEAYLEKKKMAKKLDKVYIVDIEAACWEKKSPDGQMSEIIQVGIARIEELVMTALGYVLPQIL